MHGNKANNLCYKTNMNCIRKVFMTGALALAAAASALSSCFRPSSLATGIITMPPSSIRMPEKAKGGI